MTKKAYFYIDDTFWVLRDITRQRPEKLFDNPFLKMLKNAHDNYGLKAQLNLFYRADSFYGYDQFTLADVTDAYKAEFEDASDWLKFAFHALEEFPDYPHVNATYEDTKWLFEIIKKEVLRFAGEKSFTYTTCPHWLPTSKDGVRALKDCGVKLMDATAGDVEEYNGDPNSLPYGHAFRLLNNRQPETKLFTRKTRDAAISRSICGYNHLTQEQWDEIYDTTKKIYDEETGILFKKFNSTLLNATPFEEMEEEYAPLLDREYVGICIHEQYFYADYFAYQPDFADKVNKMCEILTGAGFKFINGDEILE